MCCSQVTWKRVYHKLLCFQKLLKEYKDIVAYNIAGATKSSIIGWVRKALNLGRLESSVARSILPGLLQYFQVTGCTSPGRWTVAIQKSHNGPTWMILVLHVFWDAPLYTETRGLGFNNLMVLLSVRYLELSSSPLIRGKRVCADCNGGFYRPWLEICYCIDKNSVIWLSLTTRKAGKWSPATCPWGKGDLFEHIAILCKYGQNHFHSPRATKCLIFWFIKSGYYMHYKDSVRTNEKCVSYMLPKDFVPNTYLISGG